MELTALKQKLRESEKFFFEGHHVDAPDLCSSGWLSSGSGSRPESKGGSNQILWRQTGN
jgi:hypothetical protein